ncbi:ribosome small subunit-dependent GTPase A [Albidovulum sp.]
MELTGVTLTELGWHPRLGEQIDDSAAAGLVPMRVTGVHRDRVSALGEAGPAALALPSGLPAGDVAVGDWILADAGAGRVARLLERRSRIFRRAAGDASREQLIVANVDTAFITTSCTREFNEARLERYLALVHAGGVAPAFVLTKTDLCDDPAAYLDRLRAIAPAVPAVALDARDAAAVRAALSAWCGTGQTVVFLGMSGVGKSTLVGALTGRALATGAVREDDMRGRHTTTAREMHPLPGGGWLIDTPGMRELRLADMGEGIDETFADIVELAASCRFRDCSHGPEPGCAVQQAVRDGRLDEGRLRRWQKLRDEDTRHSAAGHEARRRQKAFARQIVQAKRAKKGRDGD